VERIDYSILADEVLQRCEILSRYSEEPGRITRPFPSAAMHGVHTCLGGWMEAAGLTVRLDPAGNLIGHSPAEKGSATPSTFLIGSHLDSVPNAGKYDGILGVLLGVAAIQALRGKRLAFAIDVVGFCEEEGIRFRSPYLGSLALSGRFDGKSLDRIDETGVSLAEALRSFGLDPTRVGEAAYQAAKLLGYLEVHIEQGPVLDSCDLPLGIVEAIVGQSRCWLRFEGRAGHAGTLPMDHRHDALAAAAEFVLAVEEHARSIDGLRATVGILEVAPGAVNVVPGSVRLSLDVRHRQDPIRERVTTALLERARAIAQRRGVELWQDPSESYPAVPADARLTELLTEAITAAGYPYLRMASGAGHDAAVMAGLTPMAMLFVRSPGGVSHHPDEAVRASDVTAALEVLSTFLARFRTDTIGVRGELGARKS
jgi:allantoate deiminase